MERKSSTAVAADLVRMWTRVYTWRMATDVREMRLDEIESDLWELEHDPVSRGVSPALQIVARLLMGVPADLFWRGEQASLEPEPVRLRAMMTAAVALLVAAMWILPAWYLRADSRS